MHICMLIIICPTSGLVTDGLSAQRASNADSVSGFWITGPFWGESVWILVDSLTKGQQFGSFRGVRHWIIYR